MQRIKNDKSYEEKIDRSRFIVTLKYVEHVDQAKEFISRVGKEHKNASHNCWAYIVGKTGEYEHSSDNGEPAGTAGKPMLNALNRYHLTNVALVVTRYFGGVKLGIRGLIDAYGGVVEKAIEMNKTTELVDYFYYTIITSYDYHNILQYKLQQFDLEIYETNFSAEVEIKIKVKDTIQKDLESALREQANNLKIKYKKED